jgi:hypothetical protein
MCESVSGGQMDVNSSAIHKIPAMLHYRWVQLLVSQNLENTNTCRPADDDPRSAQAPTPSQKSPLAFPRWPSWTAASTGFNNEPLPNAHKSTRDLGAMFQRGSNRLALPGTLHRISATLDRAGEVIGLTYRFGRCVSSLELRLLACSRCC